MAGKLPPIDIEFNNSGDMIVAGEPFGGLRPRGTILSKGALGTVLTVTPAGVSWENPTGVTSDEMEIFVDGRIADLVDSAPTVLDTLRELAEAMDNDPNFLLTLQNDINSIQTDVSDLNSDLASLTLTVSGKTQVSNITPADLNPTPIPGVSLDAARADHVHRLPNIDEIIPPGNNDTVLSTINGDIVFSKDPLEYRIYYDQLPLNGTTSRKNLNPIYPMDNQTFDNRLYIYSRFLYNSWLSLPHKFFEITTNNSVVETLEFPTPEDYRNYLNDNIPNIDDRFAVPVVLKHFDIVSNKIPTVNNIMGYNRVFSTIAGKKRQQKNVNTAVLEESPNYPANISRENWYDLLGGAFALSGNSLVEDIWNQLFYDYNVFNGETDILNNRVTWLANVKSKKFDMPRSTNNFEFLVSPFWKKAVDLSAPSSGVIDIPAGTNFTIHKALFATFDNNSLAINFDVIDPMVDIANIARNARKRFLTNENISTVLIFGLIANISGNDVGALYIKPVGIDALKIDKPPVGYSIEAVFDPENMPNNTFKTLSSVLSENEYEIRFSRDSFFPDLNIAKRLLRQRKSSLDVYFRLRSTEDPRKVGQLSRTKVSLVHDGAYSIGKFIIS